MLVVIAAFVVGCGGGKHKSVPASGSTANSATTRAGATSITSPASPTPLKGEAAAAATGDIPDNQVFLRYADTGAGYSMKYPEGWAQQGSGSLTTLRDKNNIIRIVVAPGGPVDVSAARNDVSGVSGAKIMRAPQAITVSGSTAVKVTYTTKSAPSAVTGKRLMLVVDRYYLWHGGKRAIVDLGTPVGVDNVDAYRMMIESFRWR